MKRIFTLFLALFAVGAMSVNAQNRYESEVFTDAQIAVQSNVIYGANFNPYVDSALVGGGTQVQPLFCDIYYPDTTADNLKNRPVIIYMHTGSFLPPSVTNSCTGGKGDSAAVAMCRRYARHGFVAISATYRTGWLANSTLLDLRRGTNLLAVYYSIQDMKSLVRFVNATELGLGNPYGVDGDNVILVGQGSGGYIGFAYATIDNLAEVTVPSKFQYQDSVGLFGQPVLPGQSYIDTSLFGDWNGLGGAGKIIGQNPLGLPILDPLVPQRNVENHKGLPDKILMACNMGGALGDSGWMAPGDVPMVSVHSRYDFFAPYIEGTVQVPVGAAFFPVIFVQGSHWVIERANSLGNNAIFTAANYMDPLWLAGINNPLNTGSVPGIFTMGPPPPNAVTPWVVNNAPFEYWDPTDSVCVNVGNPNDIPSSKAYLDTCFRYFHPRIITALIANGVNVGSEKIPFSKSQLKLYPNPAQNQINVLILGGEATLNTVEVLDITGKLIYTETVNNLTRSSINTSSWNAGIYMVRATTNKGTAMQKVIIE